MANFSVANLKDDLTGIGHGTNLNKVKNVYALMGRAARNVLAKVDPDMTIKIVQITNAVHNDIFDYTCPTDLKGKKVLDIRPQVKRGEKDSLSQRMLKTFDLKKRDNTFAIRFDSGEKILRLSKAVSPGQRTLHEMDSITDNGAWAVGDDAINLKRDTLDYMSGNASLNFDLDGSGTTGYIEISDMTEIDLSDEDERGTIFVRVNLPDPSIITNVILDWGNDDSNYWSRTVTSPHDKTNWNTGWNILAFLWNGADEEETVDPSAIDYLKITITYDGTAETDILVDKISCSKGEIWEIVYYSENLFRDSDGNWIAKPTADSDIVNLDEDGYNILVNECGYLMAQQQQGEDMRADADFFRRELYGHPDHFSIVGRQGLYDKYNEDHPSQALKPIEKYWDFNTYRRGR